MTAPPVDRRVTLRAAGPGFRLNAAMLGSSPSFGPVRIVCAGYSETPVRVTGSISTFTELHRFNRHLEWGDSHILLRHYVGDNEQPIPLVPETNRIAFEHALRKWLTEETVWEWIESFSRFDYLEAALGRIPDKFIGHYFSKTPGDPFYAGA